MHLARLVLDSVGMDMAYVTNVRVHLPKYIQYKVHNPKAL